MVATTTTMTLAVKAATQRRATGSFSNKKIISTSSVCLLVILLLLLPDSMVAYPRMCREARRMAAWRNLGDDFDVSSCTYGWETDVCGVRRCTKGPGDLCGGKHQRYGICGEGLMCSSCNRCYGCSLKTFECYEDRTCNYFLKKR